MALQADRVGDLLEGMRRRSKALESPEGVLLDVRLASAGERATAFLVDLFFMVLAIGVLYALAMLLFFSHTNLSVGMTVILFAAFLVRNLYFLHFELAWQGRTPGKRICGLRVINRAGGELTPSAVIARNLTREVEFFLPLSMLLRLGVSSSLWQSLTLFGWTLALALLPLFNRERLRAGDLIGGTQVIFMPRRMLLEDLALADAPPTGSASARKTAAARHSFTHKHLGYYGAFELQILEELLRNKTSAESDRLLADVFSKISRKIGWGDPVAPGDIRRFLTDFYTAQRAELERAQLFGRGRADKGEAAAQNREK